MSSTVSCRSAAQSVSVSSRSPAQIFATSSGWVMNSSPELAPLVGVALAGEGEGALERLAADPLPPPRCCAPIDREEVAEHRPCSSVRLL